MKKRFPFSGIIKIDYEYRIKGAYERVKNDQKLLRYKSGRFVKKSIEIIIQNAVNYNKINDELFRLERHLVGGTMKVAPI